MCLQRATLGALLQNWGPATHLQGLDAAAAGKTGADVVVKAVMAAMAGYQLAQVG